MSQYEVIFILSPQLSEEDADAATLSLQKVVEKKGGVLAKVEKWGRRALAYSIKKHKEGYYVLFVIEGSGEAITELERKFKQTDEVLRYLTVRTDLEQKALAKRLKRREAEEARKAARRHTSTESTEAAEKAATE